MPKAGYCKECNRNVWLNDDGCCENGHDASSIASVYDAEVQEVEERMTATEKKKPKKPVLPLVLVGIIAAIFAIGIAIASLTPGKKETKVAPEKVEKTEDEEEVSDIEEEAEEEKADVQILSHNHRIGDSGYYIISGEVQNRGKKPAEYVKVTATGYDMNKEVVATEDTYTNIERIESNAKSPFEMNIDKDIAPKIESYELNIQWETIE